MLSVIELKDEKKWDMIVQSFKDYDVYYLSGYVKAFQAIGDGEPLLFYFEGNGTRAINVVMKRDIGRYEPLCAFLKKDVYFDFTTPYGYGGFIIEGEETKLLEQEYSDYCRKHHIISEIVRFHPLLCNERNVQNIYDEVCLGKTITVDTETPDTIWENFSSKNRNMVRKAQKAGLKTYWTRDESIIEVFMELYNATMDKDRAEEYYYFDKKFYESILNDLKYQAMWFYTKLEERIAAISIFLFANGKMHYHLSASRKEYNSIAPTNLLLYEAALWASQNGYRMLHLGGGLGANCDSLYHFKKQFNRRSDTNFYLGKKIFNEEIYNELVGYRKLEKGFCAENAFFPLYRAR